jgi:hypothetical protein
MRSFQSADHEYPCGNTMRRDDMRLEPAALRSSCGNPETNEADASTMPRRKKNGKEMEVYDSFAVTTYGCRTATPTESLTIVLNASPAPGDPISFFLFSSLYIHFSVFVPLYTFFCFRPSIYIFLFSSLYIHFWHFLFQNRSLQPRLEISYSKHSHNGKEDFDIIGPTPRKNRGHIFYYGVSLNPRPPSKTLE